MDFSDADSEEERRGHDADSEASHGSSMYAPTLKMSGKESKQEEKEKGEEKRNEEEKVEEEQKDEKDVQCTVLL